MQPKGFVNNQIISGFPLGDTKRGNIYVQYDKNMYIVTFNFGIKDNFNVSGWSDIANISLPFMNKMATETHIFSNQADGKGRTIGMRVYMTPDSNILRFGNLGQSYSNVKQNDIWFRGQLVGFIK